MTLQLQKTAQWLGQILQQRGLNTPLNIPYVANGVHTTEPQPTFNHQISQQSSRRTGEGSRGAGGEEEPAARTRGRRVRELIENDEAESYSTGDSQEDRERRMGRRVSPEEEAKAGGGRRRSEVTENEGAALAELGAKDNS